MLINLSNHPAKNWGEKQRQLALEKYGQIEDLPFPQISPEADEKEINELVNIYLTKVIEKKPQAVHIMGEMTFTAKLVAALQSNGILCLASTTRRIAVEEGNKKISVFEFVRFRRYPDLCPASSA